MDHININLAYKWTIGKNFLEAGEIKSLKSDRDYWETESLEERWRG